MLAKPLRDVPPGADVYIDANVFVYAMLQKSQECLDFIRRCGTELHGFSDAGDYWTRASSKPLLQHVAVPTLVLNAQNDPFLPAHALPTQAEVSPAVRLETLAHGGHVGFVHGAFPGRYEWLPQRVLSFFSAEAKQ